MNRIVKNLKTLDSEFTLKSVAIGVHKLLLKYWETTYTVKT